jgi:PadR family transcriptional regulator, regulatory protein PadR
MAVATSKKMLRDVFLAFMRVHLLHHAAADRIYGLEMIEELRRHGYKVGPGTLYPMLHGMEADGYLRSEQELAGGKVRKYYRITPAGRKILEQLKQKIRELGGEVLGDASRTL